MPPRPLTSPYRLCFYFSNRNVFSHVLNWETGQIVAEASTAEQSVREQLGGNVNAAAFIGESQGLNVWCLYLESVLIRLGRQITSHAHTHTIVALVLHPT